MFHLKASTTELCVPPAKAAYSLGVTCSISMTIVCQDSNRPTELAHPRNSWLILWLKSVSAMLQQLRNVCQLRLRQAYFVCAPKQNEGTAMLMSHDFDPLS